MPSTVSMLVNGAGGAFGHSGERSKGVNCLEERGVKQLTSTDSEPSSKDTSDFLYTRKGINGINFFTLFCFPFNDSDIFPSFSYNDFLNIQEQNFD
ncbi:hypothetical protein L1887_07587 [Cichorium endivia]|nr:hypothetical protein L1887_07587 [Cichorium endivia]